MFIFFSIDTSQLLEINFYTAVWWLIYLQAHTDSYSTNYIVQHEKVTTDDKLAQFNDKFKTEIIRR